jgi:uncharacterized protein (TIRG00374 family)
MEGANGLLQNTKRIAVFVVKVAVATGLIYWLCRQGRLDFKSLAQLTFDVRTVALLLAGAVSVFCGLLLLGWRIRMLLCFQRFDVSYGTALGLTLIGSFFGAVLPGLIGGDGVKAVYVCRWVSERRVDALAAIVIDRVLGLYSLVLLGALAFLVAWITNSVPFHSPVLAAMPAILLLGAAGMFLVSRHWFIDARPVRKFVSWLPDVAQRLIRAMRNYLESPRLVLTAIVLSVLNHSLVVIGFVLAALLLQNELSMFTHFILNPIAMVMNGIPLTPGGLGLSESAFSFLFQAAGSSQGAMVGLLGRFIQYGVFAVGGSVALFFLKWHSYIRTTASPL